MNNRINLKLAALLIALFLLAMAVTARAQSCTLKTQGYLGGCSNVNVFFFTQTPSSQIARFELNTFAGRFTAASSAKSFSIPTGCGTGGQVIITEVRTNGSTCSAQYSGNLPHNRACSTCTTTGGLGTTVVSSANFRGSVSRNSLISFFPDPGVTFTDLQQFATTIPLPTQLAGVTVSIDGTLLGLVSVAPGQINAHLPEWLPEGPTEIFAAINTTRGSVPSFVGRPQLNPNAPGIFTAAANGTGQAASVWLVVRPNGTQGYFAPGNVQFSGGDTVVLVLFATGINESRATLYLGNGRTFPAQYCGPSVGLVGLQQLNFIIPTGDVWRVRLGAFVRVFTQSGGSFDSQGVEVW